MLTDSEIKAALTDLMEIKRALQRKQIDPAWKSLRAIELKLGRGLRKGPQSGAHATSH